MYATLPSRTADATADITNHHIKTIAYPTTPPAPHAIDVIDFLMASSALRVLRTSMTANVRRVTTNRHKSE